MTLDPGVRDRLIEQARALAAARGWAWHDPADVTTGAERGEPVWIVRSNALNRGQNVLIVFRQSDREVVRTAYLPR